VDLTRTLTDLREEYQRVDAERRAVADELAACQQSVNELNEAKRRVTELDAQLTNFTAQVNFSLCTLDLSCSVKPLQVARWCIG